MAVQHPTSSETDPSRKGLEPVYPNRPVDALPRKQQPFVGFAQLIRGIVFLIFFVTCCLSILVTQLIGAPLYLVNREWFYAYMAMTKRSFGLTLTFMTSVWAPVTVRISGDETVAEQIQPTPDGSVRFNFPERMVLFANHQIDTDWLYLWWVSYANRPAMHGHLYIILKESLKWVPVLGWGMQFYNFIFLSRKMAADRPRLSYRLNKLKRKHTDPSGKTFLDPMWLLLFPEGTNVSPRTRGVSAKWAAKTGLRDPDHVLLPRSTGIFFCLNELRGTIDYVYDCTVAYEGVPRGKFGEDFFTLHSSYVNGRPPKSINLYWRRFRIEDLPLDDQDAFDVWLREQWYLKDALMDQYLTTGRFPASANSKLDYVHAFIKTRNPLEVLQVFTVVGIAGLFRNNVRKAWTLAGRLVGQ
ncbi:hypothetical protein S40288_01556 [Stachybotrys chartarum IBT 40288]|nr:hypothetical protein S40288_01556 [Stachybotrys chartarum IBT 40288]